MTHSERRFAPTTVRQARNGVRYGLEQVSAFIGIRTERAPLSDSAREMPVESPENAFLTSVREMMEAWKKGAGASEMNNWGGWWRNKFRKNAKKARAVLNDVRSLVNERRITKNPGNAAVDLWKRLP